jgi:hypothetical protein
MSFRVFIPLLMLLSAACACVRAAAGPAPAPRTGEAEVRETGGGLPCFTISEREERKSGAPNFDSITVYDASARPRAKMWGMTMPAQRTFPLLFSMCVPYGGRVPSLPQTVATMLETGKMYEVLIDVRSDDTPNQTRIYAARFCLAKQRDGSVAVHHVGSNANDWRNAQACTGSK